MLLKAYSAHEFLIRCKKNAICAANPRLFLFILSVFVHVFVVFDSAVSDFATRCSIRLDPLCLCWLDRENSLPLRLLGRSVVASFLVHVLGNSDPRNLVPFRALGEQIQL